ncbi:MAG TPA: glycosyltransferase family 9 protein [Legionellaceae bacterium]|nr:glycosyltransferase family 9 protein [Legionellaceae bacterium]
MVVPLIRTLQKAFPNAQLTWVISRPAYDLVEGMENVEFIVIDKPNHLKDYWHFKQCMRHRKFDVLLAVQASFRANLLYACISARRRIGYDSLRAKDGHGWFINECIAAGNDHTLDGFLRFAEALDVKTFDIRWDLPIPAEDHAWAKMHLPPKNDGPIIVVNPAASKQERSWRVERYIAVLQHLQQRWHAQIILTGGPGAYDRVLGDAIAEAVPVTNLIGKTKPKQLLALLSLVDIILCPDTGPSHMGVAVHTPVIALHAVTSSEVSGPYLYRHLAVDNYPEAVRTVLNKTPEMNIWGTHAHGMHTMDLVTVEAVIARLDQVLTDPKLVMTA